MKRIFLIGCGLLLGYAGAAQIPVDIYSATSGQTQPLRATNSIELGDGFSSTSEIDITIAPVLNVTGQWSPKENWGFIGIHTHVLPSGRVLSWQGHNDNDFVTPGAAHPGTDAFLLGPDFSRINSAEFHFSWTNAFCTGHSFLPDGRLFVTGGHSGDKDRFNNSLGYIKGLNHASTYDYKEPAPSPANPASGWQAELRMERNRWYPTNTTLSNGDVLTTAGETEPIQIVPVDQRFPELWHSSTGTTPPGAATGSWTKLENAPRSLPLYPWMFQAPNGKVFYAGADNNLAYLNPAYQNSTTLKYGLWTDMTDMTTPPRAFGVRTYGTAAMFWPGKILIVGGSDGRSITNTAEVIDLVSGTALKIGSDGFNYKESVVAPAASMRNVRWHANSTLLPDGSVLVTGGSRVITDSDRNQAVLDAEIWTPTPGPNGPTGPGTWTTAAPLKEARMYHSTAVLLPDGRVLTAGGEEVTQPFVLGQNNHPNAEIYSPPYLFDADGNPRARPVIMGAPAHVGYGQLFTVVATTGGGPVARVTLVRLSSVTHSFNMNQRFLELDKGTGSTTAGAASVPVTAPADGSVCPPGHYLLFVLNSSGVPSVGRVVHVGPSPCAAEPALSTAYAVSADNCSATATATVSGQNLGTDYRWTVNGVPDARFDNQASASVALDLCQPQATLGVRVTPSCGGAPVENFVSASHNFSPTRCSCGSQP